MKPNSHLAIIGSGPTAICLLKRLVDSRGALEGAISSISIFEKGQRLGTGMPYSSETTDPWHLSNITSEELPELVIPFADWLAQQDDETLGAYEIAREEISSTGIYSRLALGDYFANQFARLRERLADQGMKVSARANCEIVDITDNDALGQTTLISQDDERFECDLVVIATGHSWSEEDRPDGGYYASPWPIQKLAPPSRDRFDFEVGTLGASLSAFDVASSLAHGHGTFTRTGAGLRFEPRPDAPNFRIAMHSAHGRLPHVQYEQQRPFREIYRLAPREALLALKDGESRIRLEDYFDKICRPALVEAFRKDERMDVVELLADGCSLTRFIQELSSEHQQGDAFERLRMDLAQAREDKKRHRPFYWKETLDDLIYTLNYHAESMPAEDHITLHSVVMPFLLNVIAAVPLRTAELLLALRDAGCLRLVEGLADISPPDEAHSRTRVTPPKGSEAAARNYRVFIDCSGQRGLTIEDFPFPSLVASGTVRRARVRFADLANAAEIAQSEGASRLVHEDGELAYALEGIDIDDAHRVLGKGGKRSQRIHDVAYPHTSGMRPYSYGLQACYHAATKVVESWAQEVQQQPRTSVAVG